MANIYNLKNAQITLSGADAGTDLGLGAVPKDKNRFIVGVKMETITASATITLGQTDAATGAISAANKKLVKKLDGTFVYPENPDINTPIFSIDSGKYLAAVTTAGVTDTELTVLYYDD